MQVNTTEPLLSSWGGGGQAYGEQGCRCELRWLIGQEIKDFPVRDDSLAFTVFGSDFAF